MPTDRYHFSSADGLKNLPFESFKLPSEHWKWLNEWSFEQNTSEVSLPKPIMIFPKHSHFLIEHLFRAGNMPLIFRPLIFNNFSSQPVLDEKNGLDLEHLQLTIDS